MKYTMRIAAALLALGVVTACGTPAEQGTRGADALTIIHQRKSVRSFTGAPVDKALLEKLVRAGMAAPSAVNRQPWAFVVVSDRAALDALAAKLPYAKMLAKAGAAIVVCGIPAKAFAPGKEFAVIDAALASQNILLAAEALGLGAVFTACYPDDKRMDAVRGVLGIPADVIPLNVIPVGHPTGTDKPKDKWKPENVRWGKW